MKENTLNYEDIVRIAAGAPREARPGNTGWIVGIYADRVRFPLIDFAPGTVYQVEYQDSKDALIHENYLDKID